MRNDGIDRRCNVYGRAALHGMGAWLKGRKVALCRKFAFVGICFFHMDINVDFISVQVFDTIVSGLEVQNRAARNEVDRGC
jgi:hypothetical protein